MKYLGPYFTAQARAAAKVARIKRAAQKAFIKNDMQVFVTKGACGSTEFTWELRRFGGLTVQDTTECYASMAMARDAGDAALILWNADTKTALTPESLASGTSAR